MSVHVVSRSCRSPRRSPCAGSWSGSRRTGSSSSGRSRSSAGARRPSPSARDTGGTTAALPLLSGRESQASPRACLRPSGKSMRYCCSGSTPKAWEISKSAELAVRPVGVHEVPAVAAEERGRDAGVREFRVREVAEHRLVRGGLHGPVVLGTLPRRGLAGMALNGRPRRRRRPGRRPRRAQAPLPTGETTRRAERREMPRSPARRRLPRRARACDHAGPCGPRLALAGKAAACRARLACGFVPWCPEVKRKGALSRVTEAAAPPTCSCPPSPSPSHAGD